MLYVSSVVFESFFSLSKIDLMSSRKQLRQIMLYEEKLDEFWSKRRISWCLWGWGWDTSKVWGTRYFRWKSSLLFITTNNKVSFTICNRYLVLTWLIICCRTPLNYYFNLTSYRHENIPTIVRTENQGRYLILLGIDPVTYIHMLVIMEIQN